MKNRTAKSILVHGILILGAFSALMPLMWMISTSFKPAEDIFSLPPQWIPDPPTLANYERLFTSIPFARQFLNTFIVSTSIVIGQLLFSSMAAYAFARLRFPGRNVLFFAFLSTLMVPNVATLVPSFIVVRELGWINNYLGLIGPYLLGSAIATFLIRQFMLTIPAELEDAARMDGAGHIKIFFLVILPLTRPALAVVGLFAFVFFWNDFLWPLIIINSESMKTLTVSIASLSASVYGTDWGVLMAGATMTILPLIAVFLLTQKYFLEGIQITGLK